MKTLSGEICIAQFTDNSDEELEMLSDLRRDYLWEGKWGALGVCLGSAPTAIPTFFGNVFWDKVVSTASLIQIIIFFVSVSIYFVLMYVVTHKSTASQNLVDAIRKRTAKQVT